MNTINNGEQEVTFFLPPSDKDIPELYTSRRIIIHRMLELQQKKIRIIRELCDLETSLASIDQEISATLSNHFTDGIRIRINVTETTP